VQNPIPEKVAIFPPSSTNEQSRMMWRMLIVFFLVVVVQQQHHRLASANAFTFWNASELVCRQGIPGVQGDQGSKGERGDRGFAGVNDTCPDLQRFEAANTLDSPCPADDLNNDNATVGCVRLQCNQQQQENTLPTYVHDGRSGKNGRNGTNGVQGIRGNDSRRELKFVLAGEIPGLLETGDFGRTLLLSLGTVFIDDDQGETVVFTDIPGFAEPGSRYHHFKANGTLSSMRASIQTRESENDTIAANTTVTIFVAREPYPGGIITGRDFGPFLEPTALWMQMNFTGSEFFQHVDAPSTATVRLDDQMFAIGLQVSQFVTRRQITISIVVEWDADAA
jgi:hypothetical protein